MKATTIDSIVSRPKANGLRTVSLGLGALGFSGAAGSGVADAVAAELAVDALSGCWSGCLSCLVMFGQGYVAPRILCR